MKKQYQIILTPENTADSQHMDTIIASNPMEALNMFLLYCYGNSENAVPSLSRVSITLTH
jgi:hypothetical protein